MKGTTKGTVHDAFTKRLNDLRDKSSEIADSLDSGSRPWMLPEGLQSRDLLHVPSLHAPDWDRDKINANYDEVFASAEAPGTVGDVIAIKTQVDYMAMEERAFRLRHATIVRCQIHAHGRRSAHGLSNGVFGAMERRVTNTLRAGGLT